MLTIGLSGIPFHEEYLRQTYPDRPEGDYRIRQGMDAAAALVLDGKVIGCVAQERVDRQKQSSAFPDAAIQALLEKNGFGIADVDAFAYAYNYGALAQQLDGKFSNGDSALFQKVLNPDLIRDELKRAFPSASDIPVHFVDHHVAHAASVYFPSGLADPLILVSDAMGEVASTSVFVRDDDGFRRVGQQSSLDSIGIFYSLVTMLLGFEFNGDEYKIMGLAPYGDPEIYADRFEDLIQLSHAGQVRIDSLRENRTQVERAFFEGSREAIRLCLGLDAEPEKICLQDKQNVAAALQKRAEEAVLHITHHFQQSTGKTTLAYAGGVAMNCCANRKIAEAGHFENLYVGCASGDDGSALGAALHAHAQMTGRDSIVFDSPYMGPSEAAASVEHVLQDYLDHVAVQRFNRFEDLCDSVVNRLVEKDVVAWHFGASEFGARALGNRSILADPRHDDIQDKVNNVVKQRESFRPFAPIAMKEHAEEFFEVLPSVDYSYMTVVTETKPEHRHALPAVTHVDGSARLQTVSKQQNPKMHALLDRFRRFTGIGVLLNTSFNIKGQPIVNTAREAIDTFLSTGLDGLVIEGILLTKIKKQEPAE